MWGVDTTTTIGSSFLTTIKSHVGTPVIVGQYLDTGGGQHLTSSQATYIHNQNIGIVLLFSPNDGILATHSSPPFDHPATAQQVADSEAATAVSEAEAVGANPYSGIALYRDVEVGYSISSVYIDQWYSDVTAAGYIPGFYENSVNGQFEGAFCAAASTTISGTYLYATESKKGTSYNRSAAPTTYNPYYVVCESAGQMSGWQYLNSDALPGGPIDVDEFAQVGIF